MLVQVEREVVGMEKRTVNRRNPEFIVCDAQKELVESILDEFAIPKRKGYRILRSVILYMYQDANLNMVSAQKMVAAESGMPLHNVRYAMESAIASAQGEIPDDLRNPSGRISSKGFVEYCICKLPSVQ